MTGYPPEALNPIDMGFTISELVVGMFYPETFIFCKTIEQILSTKGFIYFQYY
jgi:hypothetical protein